MLLWSRWGRQTQHRTAGADWKSFALNAVTHLPVGGPLWRSKTPQIRPRRRSPGETHSAVCGRCCIKVDLQRSTQTFSWGPLLVSPAPNKRQWHTGQRFVGTWTPHGGGANSRQMSRRTEPDVTDDGRLTDKPHKAGFYSLTERRILFFGLVWVFFGLVASLHIFHLRSSDPQSWKVRKWLRRGRGIPSPGNTNTIRGEQEGGEGGGGEQRREIKAADRVND